MIIYKVNPDQWFTVYKILVWTQFILVHKGHFYGVCFSVPYNGD